MTKIISFDDLEASIRPVDHRPEDDHLTRVDPGLPVGGVAAHDLLLLGGHVECERRTGSFQSEDDGRHCLRTKDRGAHRERRPIGQALRSDPAIDQASTEASQATHSAPRSQALGL